MATLAIFFDYNFFRVLCGPMFSGFFQQNKKGRRMYPAAFFVVVSVA